MIVGTAGHIDHGKSALVAALTGHTVDRLAEERRRGITIDLGFAPFPLPDGRVAGVVDVPGHEDFIRTMVAGASGVDLALLVIAADEGIMPQTLEHLIILEQLGITAGIPVITKTDLVEAEWLELVTLDIRERLAASRIGFEAPAQVSTRSGAGVAELRERLQRRLAAIPSRGREDLFRMPVDRSFSVAGIGTVITGTCWSGSIAVGDAIRILPAGSEGRVRSTESHGAPAAVKAGARTAIGVAGLDRGAIARGDVAVATDTPWLASRAIDVRLDLDRSAPRPLARRQRIRLLLGTGEWIGWASPRTPIAPGSRGLARVTLEREIVARGGDRFVLRGFSPVSTIGGGEVLDPAPPLRGAAWTPALGADDAAIRLFALVSRRRHGVAARLLPILLGLPAAECARLARADARLARCGTHWIAAETVRGLAAKAGASVSAHHDAHPAQPGMPLETLRRVLNAPEWLAAAAIELVMADGTVSSVDGVVRARGFRPSGAGGTAEVDAVVAELDAAGLTPPTVAELAQRLGRADVATSLRAAAASGRIEAVERDRYYARSALDRFVSVLAEIAPGGEFGVGTVRDRIGVSRKFLIPLLEWSDARGITIRSGDARRFRGAVRDVAPVSGRGSAAPA
jgi:selenocysteine-specific elongation factor